MAVSVVLFQIGERCPQNRFSASFVPSFVQIVTLNPDWSVNDGKMNT